MKDAARNTPPVSASDLAEAHHMDDALAVAAAAHGNNTLLIAGLAISIPLIIFGSTLLLKVMQRFPIIITLGAGLLGYLAGEMLMTDPALESRFGALPHLAVSTVGAVGAVLVVVTGKWLLARSPEPAPE